MVTAGPWKHLQVGGCRSDMPPTGATIEGEVGLGASFEPALVAARHGAEWAWAALYRDVAPGVLRYLRARGVAEPEEVLGDVFLQVVRKLTQFEGGESAFKGWVMTIAHHRVIDEARRRARRPVQAAPSEVIEAAAPVGDAEAEAQQSLATQRVKQVLARLSPDQEDVLVLRMIGGLSIEQVAEATGKTIGAVKSLQARGLAAIRRELAREAVSL